MLPKEEKDFRYLSSEDVNLRLKSSVVRVSGEPVYVKGTTGNGLKVIYFHLLDQKKEGVVHSSDSELDISSPLLGNCFTRGRVEYLARGTDKLQRQGLDPSRISRYSDDFTDRGFAGQWEELGKTIKGVFPTFSEAKEVGEMPFGRYLSLGRTKDTGVLKIRHLVNTIGLYFKTDSLGLVFKPYYEDKMIQRLSPFMEVRAC